MSWNILIVEDENIIALQLRQSLEQMGYSVVAVSSSAEEALDLAQTHSPDLVLMDILLNGEMDGITAAGIIHRTLHIPVVYLTAHADEATLKRAQITEPGGYLVKPYDDQELKAAVEMNCFAGRKRGEGYIRDGVEISWGWSDGATPTENDSPRKSIENLSVFKNVSVQVLERLTTRARLVKIKAKDSIYLEGDEYPVPFLVCSGRIAIGKSSVQGKELTVDVVMPGDPLGLYLALEVDSAPIYARAATPSVVLCLDRASFKMVLDECEAVRKNIMTLSRARLDHAYELARSLAHDNVETRIATMIYAMSKRLDPTQGINEGEPDSSALDISMTRQELAILSGVSLETAIRVTRSMEERGILSLKHRGRIQILDVEKLTDLE